MVFKFVRLFDVLLSFLGIVFLAPIIVAIMIVCFIDTRSPIFSQTRVGENMKPFLIFKFRTMKKNTIWTATHLVDARAITCSGQVLRKYKLDEIPQLWNVLIGDMSLVGPRPCLFSQRDLLAERKARGITMNKPGITGLGQLHGIDMRNPKRLACLDRRMMSSLSLESYFKYLSKTVCSLIVCKKNVSISKLLS